MTRIDFYSNTRDKLEIVRKLVNKALETRQCVLIHAPDTLTAGEVDAYLWTHPPLSFLPHVRTGHPLARQTSVLIGTDPDELASADLLINLAFRCSPRLSKPLSSPPPSSNRVRLNRVRRSKPLWLGRNRRPPR
jgi:DNA polymerase-3 subunit chi